MNPRVSEFLAFFASAVILTVTAMSFVFLLLDMCLVLSFIVKNKKRHDLIREQEEKPKEKHATKLLKSKTVKFSKIVKKYPNENSSSTARLRPERI